MGAADRTHRPRYVTFQLDVLWAADTGADPVALLRRHGDRLALLHVKDGVGIAASGDATPIALGEGELDLPADPAGRGQARAAVRLRAGPAIRRPLVRPVPDAAKSLSYLRCVAF